MTEPVSEALSAAEASPPALTASGLPFTYAQTRNVLLERSATGMTLHYVAPLATDVLLEVRRFRRRRLSAAVAGRAGIPAAADRGVSAHPERSRSDGRGPLLRYRLVAPG